MITYELTQNDIFKVLAVCRELRNADCESISAEDVSQALSLARLDAGLLAHYTDSMSAWLRRSKIATHSMWEGDEEVFEHALGLEDSKRVEQACVKDWTPRVLSEPHAVSLIAEFDVPGLVELDYRPGYYGRSVLMVWSLDEADFEPDRSLYDVAFAARRAFEAYFDEELYYVCDDAHYEHLAEVDEEYLVRLAGEIENQIELAADEDDTPTTEVRLSDLWRFLALNGFYLDHEECEPGLYYTYISNPRAYSALMAEYLPMLRQGTEAYGNAMSALNRT